MGVTDQDPSLSKHSSEEDVTMSVKEDVETQSTLARESKEDSERLSIGEERVREEEEEEETGNTNKTEEDSQSTCSSSSSHASDTPSSSNSITSSSTASTSEPQPPVSLTSSSSSSNEVVSDTPPSKDPEGSTCIQLEDNEKNFTVQELQDPNKPKTWLESFNSLAPRTRQTVRTAAIALVSALALVAIFHLAKLAEHPVNDNSIDSPLEQQSGPVQELYDEPFLKSQTGKAYRHPDNGGELNGGAHQFADAILSARGNRPLAPVQDMLARAGKNAKIHPILGVPVAPEFLEVERLQKLDRSRNRPANDTEIEKTLSLVRRKVETDRKKLTNKDLRLWTPGDAPLRVLLVTTWRSGSTFLGQVLANHPAVFQHYEPLSAKGIKQIRSGKEAFQAQQLLHRLLDCRYADLNEYLNYTHSHAEDMLGHNKPVWDSCRRGPNTNACFNATFLSNACHMFPIQLVKTVRVRLNLTQLFLNDEKMNVKVVFLVRDPRATMSSRYSSVSWCTDKPDCSSPEVLCSDLQGDLKVATALKQLYPNRFTMVKYEDMAINPHEEIQQLMEFLGMEYSSEISKYVQEHTQIEQNSPYSIKRKSADRVNNWKKQMPLNEVHVVQNACESVLKTLDYEMVGQ